MAIAECSYQRDEPDGRNYGVLREGCSLLKGISPAGYPETLCAAILMDASRIRNRRISGITIRYDWDNNSHYALIEIQESDDTVFAIKVSGLKVYDLYEDFECVHISHVKYIRSEAGEYLSLDPYDESDSIHDDDCLYFSGTKIELIEANVHDRDNSYK